MKAGLEKRRVASTNQEQAQSRPVRQTVAVWIAENLEAERRQLILFAPVALGCGIALWFLLPENHQRQAALLLAVALAVGGLALRGALWGGTLRRVVIVTGVLVASGLLLSDFRSATVAAPKLHHRLSAAPMTGTVLSVTPGAGGARWRMELWRDANAIDPAVKVRINLNATPPPGLVPGARIRVRATLGPLPGPAIPGGYDSARRGWFESLSATGRAVAPPEILRAGGDAGSGFGRMRQALGETLATRLGGDTGAVAAALVIGEGGRISEPLLESMRVAGLAHILTVSGFHISIVVGGAFWLFARLFALWPWLALRVPVRWLAALAAGGAGTAYTLLSGAELPAIRAMIAAWVVLLALVLGRDLLSPRLIALAAFVIFLLRPEALLNPSFQLSFTAVMAIVALARSRVGRFLLPRADEGWLLKLLRAIAGLAATALVAELALSPIALAHFGRAGAYGVIANIAAVPLTSLVIMPLLILWLFLLPLGLDVLVGWALRLGIDALGWIGVTVAAWPGASLTLPVLPQAAVFLLAVGALLLLLLEGRLRHLGWPLLLAGGLVALWAPRPDLLVAGNGQQLAIAAGDTLYTLRGHRQGYVVRSWAEKSDTAPTARFTDLPGSRCNDLVCDVALTGGLRLLAFLHPVPPSVPIERICASADIVTAPQGLPADCRPRWLRLDPPILVRMGAVAIDSRRRKITSVGARAGDQPWSVAAPPGMRPRLLGEPVWTGVLVE